MYGDNIVATPISYVVSYSGESITRGSITVNVMRATIDLPAVDSDVNVFVTATNLFGTGGVSALLMDEISELPIMYIIHVLYMITKTHVN